MEYASTVSCSFSFHYRLCSPRNSFSTKRRRRIPSDRKSTASKILNPGRRQSVVENEENTVSHPKHFMLVLDFDKVKTVTTTNVNRFIDSANDAWEDLKTLVTIDDRSRVVFSCRRSTLEFSGMVVLYGFVSVLAFRILVRMLIWLTNALFMTSRKEEVVVRRDRSLGGKEVVVGRSVRKRQMNKLSYGQASLGDSSSGLTDSWTTSGASRTPKLPDWWPAVNQESIDLSVVEKEEYQREASRLVQYIVDYRTRGTDIKEQDIVQLRRICRTSGVQVSFEITNTRDSFYRASVDYILNFCSSSLGYPAILDIDGESVQQFIAGLAVNIGIENMRAARMVSGAVAARSRSLFLQSWAFEAQGKHGEALVELLKICHIFRAFPPDQYSPEMEMVARGLGKNLKVEERQYLFDMFAKVCSEDCHRCAADALGLVSPFRDFNDGELNYT